MPKGPSVDSSKSAGGYRRPLEQHWIWECFVRTTQFVPNMIRRVGTRGVSFTGQHVTDVCSYPRPVASSRTIFSIGHWSFRLYKTLEDSSSRRSQQVNDPLLSLAPSELRALATSVRAGRVTAPYSVLNLQQILGEARAGRVAKRIEMFAASGMSPGTLANCLELAADALDSRPQFENMVDLVTTGPEAGGVANRSTAVVVSELFRNAQSSVLIAGYAVYQGQRVF